MHAFNSIGVGGHLNSFSYTLHFWLIYISTHFTNDDGRLAHSKINKNLMLLWKRFLIQQGYKKNQNFLKHIGKNVGITTL
jgi:hypothetical protein